MNNNYNIYITNNTDTVKVTELNNDQLSYFDFCYLNDLKLSDTTNIFESKNKELDNTDITLKKNYSPTSNEVWQRSAAWTCYILSCWSKQYPDYTWKVIEE